MSINHHERGPIPGDGAVALAATETTILDTFIRTTAAIGGGRAIGIPARLWPIIVAVRAKVSGLEVRAAGCRHIPRSTGRPDRDSLS